MNIIEKLNELDLSEKERKIAIEKFMVTVSLIDEIAQKKALLASKVVSITKARELKVLCNSLDELVKKFSILEEIHETDIYRQDPTMLNRNVIDIYKKIKYCIQVGKKYKREDGTYEPFIFNEIEWQKEINKEDIVIKDSTPSLGIEDNTVKTEPEIIPEIDLNPIKFDNSSLDNFKHVDINSYLNATEDMEDLQEKTTNFAEIRKELEGQLAELDVLKSLNESEEISFTEIEPESYGMGKAA